MFTEFKSTQQDWMQSMLQASEQHQAQYLENSFNTFTQYYQDQRVEDLQMIESGLRQIQLNTNQKFQQAGSIMARLMNETQNTK